MAFSVQGPGILEQVIRCEGKALDRAGDGWDVGRGAVREWGSSLAHL